MANLDDQVCPSLSSPLPRKPFQPSSFVTHSLRMTRTPSMPPNRALSPASEKLRKVFDEIDDLQEGLKSVEAKITHYQRQVEHPVYGKSAKRDLMGLYDQQVLLQRRKHALEKNVEGYRKAIARGRRSRSSSKHSRSGSRSSSKSSTSQRSMSSTSSAPAGEGWWCSCGVLNYTHPELQYFCWGCGNRTFDERTCWWEFEPHPDDTSPWEIDMAEPMENADNFP